MKQQTKNLLLYSISQAKDVMLGVRTELLLDLDPKLVEDRLKAQYDIQPDNKKALHSINIRCDVLKAAILASDTPKAAADPKPAKRRAKPEDSEAVTS